MWVFGIISLAIFWAIAGLEALIALSIVVIIIVWYSGGKIHAEEKKKKSSLEAKISSLKEFTVSEKIIGSNSDCLLAVDREKQKIAMVEFVNNSQKTIFVHQTIVVDYKDLLAVEIVEDGTTVSRALRGSQIGGAVIGGVLLGGVGAIIGGLSGDKEEAGLVSKLELKITVNNLTSPHLALSLIKDKTSKNSTAYATAIKSARHWQGVIEVLLKRADVESKISSQVDKSQPSTIASELERMDDLRRRMIITDAEFANFKNSLLTNAHDSSQLSN